MATEENLDAAAERLRRFVAYAGTLSGDEKGEAQVFVDRLFQAFGHQGYKEAGARLEARVKGKKSTLFADVLWPSRVLIEMKSRGEKLQAHFRQAFEYWLQLVPNRPKYVVLCNFDEFWIYNFDQQLYDPVDRVNLVDLPERVTALNFLYQHNPKPLFQNDRVAVTRRAAKNVADVFRLMLDRGEARDPAQRFILQCVVAMFAEDIGLLPRGIFTELVHEVKDGASAYDLIGALFRQMNTKIAAKGGRFKGVPYFNGGLFENPEAVDMSADEVRLLAAACSEDWSKVEPAIFGTLFQRSMEVEERHEYGAHFTSEAEIQRVVLPTIVRPWRARIEGARTLTELFDIRVAMLAYKVLDPACGSGNFL